MSKIGILEKQLDRFLILYRIIELWIKTFYNNIQSCVINYGLSSHYFNLTRGVRQGDPLSPYLFLLAVESLAIAVRENEEIKGVEIEQEETKLHLQYADDTIAVLSDIKSAHKLLQNSINYLV